jgi:hypothetical protein
MTTLSFHSRSLVSHLANCSTSRTFERLHQRYYVTHIGEILWAEAEAAVVAAAAAAAAEWAAVAAVWAAAVVWVAVAAWAAAVVEAAAECNSAPNQLLKLNMKSQSYTTTR